MKKVNLFFAIAFVAMYFLQVLPFGKDLGWASCSAQNVGINATGAVPNVKAILDIDVTGSSPKTGMLIPRMTTTERNAITSPIPESLLIYNTTTQCFEAWNQSALQWVAFGCIGCQLPGSFSATAASGTTATSFSANWTAASGATGYYLDVATDAGFTSLVSGYSNLNVNNVLTYSITPLVCNTTYYYRIRAYNACGTGTNSNTITQLTSSCCTNACAFADAYPNTTGWTQVGAGVSITGGVAQINVTGGTADNRVYKSLGCALNDGCWTADFDFRITQNQAPAFLFCLTAGTQPPLFHWIGDNFDYSYNQDLISVAYIGGTSLAIRAKDDNGMLIMNASMIGISLSTTYYIRMKRTSTTNVDLYVFSDASRTVNIAGSPVSLTIPSTIIGLNTLQHSDYWCGSSTCNAGLTVTCTVDNTNIY